MTTTEAPTVSRALIKSERPGRSILIERANTDLRLYFGREQLDSLILKYATDEDNDKYVWRKRQTIRNFRNFTKEIVRKYLASITRAGRIQRTTGTMLDQELQDYDACYWKDIAPYLLLLDEFWVGVSFPPAEGEIETEQDARDNQGAPRARAIFPQFIRNFGIDEDGDIEWVTIERTVGDKKLIDYYDDTWFGTFRDTGTPVVPLVKHGFERIPILRFAYAENDALGCQPPIGHGFMSDVNTCALGLLECVSSLFEAVGIHLRLKLIVNEPTMKMLQETGMGNATPLVEKSDPKIENGAVGQTRYLTTPNTEIDILRDLTYVQKKDELYELAGLRNPSKVNVQSGTAKMIDMIPEDETKEAVSAYLGKCDKDIVDLMASPLPSYNPKKIEVKYPTIVDGKTIADTTSETEAVSGAIKTGGLPRSKTGDQLLSERLYTKALPDADEKTLKTISEEIKSSTDQPIDTTQDLQTPQEKAKVEAAIPQS